MLQLVDVGGVVLIDYGGQEYPKMDRISKLPLGIIETILCLLPIQEAARTSILSREWRYHWTKIPKLVFDEDTFQVTTNRAELSVLEQTFDEPSQRKEMTKRCKFFYAIYQVLLMHQGPIHEFTLSMVADGSCVEIDHIILHLSKKNTVKKLHLHFLGMYKLPPSLFSLHHLTDLYLGNCTLYWQPSYSGFHSLTTLHVDLLWTNEKALLDLLSGSPSLKRLTLHSDVGSIEISGDYTIADLFQCLPVIEYLSIVFYVVVCFVPDRLPKELPTTLVHLNYLCMVDVCLIHQYGLPFLLLLIRSSPNLEKLKLEVVDYTCFEEYEMGSSTIKDYADIWLEHLNELEIIRFSNADNELDFVKLILVRSPVLKKVRIFLSDKFAKDEGLQISKILLSSPCASPLVEIIVR